MATEFKLIHLSDLHLSAMPGRIGIIDVPSELARRFKRYLRNRVPMGELFGDLYFGPSSYRKDVAERLAQTLMNPEFSDADLIVLSGDLATSGESLDLDVAKSYLHDEADDFFLSGKGQPTLDAAKRPYFLIPGNHDRYSGGIKERWPLPGGTNFDGHFSVQQRYSKNPYWNEGKKLNYTLVHKDECAERLAIIGADFSLDNKDRATGAGLTKAKNWLGQGRVETKPNIKGGKNTLEGMIALTDYLRSEHGGNIAVIWVSHYPYSPKCSSSMQLVEGERLRKAAVENDIPLILTGHRHKYYNRERSSVRIVTAGSATSCAGDNEFLSINLRVNKAEIEKTEISRYRYDFSNTLDGSQFRLVV